MKILVINAGSSSLKYQLIDMETEGVIAKGICESVGTLDKSCISYTHYPNGQEVKVKDQMIPMQDHTAAFNEVKKVLTEGDSKVIEDISEIAAVGHRVVQGGNLFNKSVLIDQSVLDGIESLCDLAPLHNAAHLQGMKASIALFGPDVPQVAVFDNAFHSTMPPEAYMFALPYEYYEKYAVRKYGFHGTSHRFVSALCAETMGKPIEDLKIITCHLGNGSSLAAVKGGKVIDTSMGLTPLDGEVMGTRCGAIDPSAVLYIMKKENKTPDEMDTLLNKQSGVYGVSGLSFDDRDIKKAAAEGNDRASLARNMQIYRIVKHIGAYVAAMDGVDAIVFTGGIGENADDMRAIVCDRLSYLGIDIDKAFNATLVKGKGGEISTKDSKVRVFVLPTNEELLIARDTRDIVNALQK